MITLNKILDSARKSCSRDSDAAVAEALKVSRQTVMQWRSGARRITDEHLMAAIELGRLDPALAVLVRQEMAETKAEKKAWSTLWDRLSAAAAVLVLVVVAMPGVARAKSFEIKGMEAGNAAVCILCSDHLGVAGTSLAASPAPTLAWSLIVRDRKLTGPWAGFSFKGGRLVTPEGRELEPQDLAWLSLTAAQAQEWRRMMESGRATGKPRKPLSFNAASVVNLSDALAQRRKKRSSVAIAGPDAEPPAAVLPVPGPKRRQRV
ncbi:DUF3693 domain-containing protein [Stenotrophomonas maltophilia]|uniref:DUF3693 domain-containing protein n=1 Tax=Stenotrophomonas maltophilia TaxID=40324 RepID=UPI000B1D3A9F|nr:DUF3693 domain-containing protein [Stenotrophomonas maltophilia]